VTTQQSLGLRLGQRGSLAHGVLKVKMKSWLQFSKKQSHVKVVCYWSIGLTHD